MNKLETYLGLEPHDFCGKFLIFSDLVVVESTVRGFEDVGLLGALRVRSSNGRFLTFEDSAMMRLISNDQQGVLYKGIPVWSIMRPEVVRDSSTPCAYLLCRHLDPREIVQSFSVAFLHPRHVELLQLAGLLCLCLYP